MITDTIKRKLALFLKETINGGTTKLGTGGGGTNPTATDLDVPLSTTETNTATSSDDKIIEIKSSFRGSNLQGYTIREVGFFGTVPKDDQFDEALDTSSHPTFTTDTVMFGRINFNAIGNFSTSDVIDVIYTVEVE